MKDNRFDCAGGIWQLRQAESTERVSVLFAGDTCPFQSVEPVIREGKSNEILAEILPLLKQNDLRVVQLETVLTEKNTPILKDGPNLKSHPDTVSFLKAASFDVALTANNHTGDFGPDALMDMLEHLQENGIRTVGAGASLAEADRPLVIEKNNLRIAILNFAEHEYGTAEAGLPGCAPLEVLDNIRLIRQCRQENDLCIAVIHGGNEQNPVPSPRQQRTYRAFADFGANAVINFHQHCPQGFEIRNGVPILYSPGNFLFPAGNFENESCRDIPWWYGYMPQLHFDRKGVYSMALHPYRTEFRPWKIHLLEGEKRKKFFEYLSRLCAILGSEEEMRRFFEAWCAKEWRGAVTSLMHGLCPEHSPESQSVRKRLWLRNIHTCESHNEAFSTICRLLEKGEADTREIRAHIEKIIAFQEYFSNRT